MLAKEEMDAVFVASGRGRMVARSTRSPWMRLRAGFHTWVEAPPCTTLEEVMNSPRPACQESLRGGRTEQMFPPSTSSAAGHGQPRMRRVRLSMRYPLSFPVAVMPTTRGHPQLLRVPATLSSAALSAKGRASSFYAQQVASARAGVVSLRYRIGVVGTVHLTGGQRPCPLERIEGGARPNVVGKKKRHPRPLPPRRLPRVPTLAQRPASSGRTTTRHLLGAEFSRGEVYNKQLFPKVTWLRARVRRAPAGQSAAGSHLPT